MSEETWDRKLRLWLTNQWKQYPKKEPLALLPVFFLPVVLLVFLYSWLNTLYLPFRIWISGQSERLTLLHATYVFSIGPVSGANGLPTHAIDETRLYFESLGNSPIIQQGNQESKFNSGSKYWVRVTSGCPSLLMSPSGSQPIIFKIIKKTGNQTLVAFLAYVLALAVGTCLQTHLLMREIRRALKSEFYRLCVANTWAIRIEGLLEFLSLSAFVIVPLVISGIITGAVIAFCFNGVEPRKEIGSAFLVLLLLLAFVPYPAFLVQAVNRARESKGRIIRMVRNAFAVMAGTGLSLDLIKEVARSKGHDVDIISLLWHALKDIIG